jgi:hypothetical protein
MGDIRGGQLICYIEKAITGCKKLGDSEILMTECVYEMGGLIKSLADLLDKRSLRKWNL